MMYENEYPIEDGIEDKIKKIVEGLKDLGMTKYMEKIAYRTYPPPPDSYAK